jgi:hypothetical protein
MNSGGNAAVNSQLVIDADNSNADNGLQQGLAFGSGGSGEGILSNRTDGTPNKWGLDLVTAYAPRVSITNAGFVGINQRAPVRPLHVEGGETHSAGSGAGYSFMNRQTPGYSDNPGERWVLYSDQGLARLWTGSADRVQIAANGNIGVRGLHPTNGAPAGWGMGLHTWDVYAEATVAAGKNGAVAAYINSDGWVVGSRKSFRIDHPLDPDKALVHAAIEGPELAVYYRGEARLEGGVARVELPAYFEKLVRPDGRTVQITTKVHGEEAGGGIASSAVQDGAFTVRGGAGTRADQGFFWEVKAVRADTPPIEVEPPREYRLETAGDPVEAPPAPVDPAAAQVETPPPPPEASEPPPPDIGPPPEPEPAPVPEVQPPPPVEPPPPPPDTAPPVPPPIADEPPVEAPPVEAPAEEQTEGGGS